MRKKFKGKHQKGQAIMEMCVCLIPIMVVVLAMIIISGFGISNIRIFNEAKANAEIASRNSGAVGGAGKMIYSWDYGDPDNDGDGYPFTADDQPVYFSQVNAANNTYSIANGMLNNNNYSQSLVQSTYPYIFMSTSSAPITNDNFAGNIPVTMLSAADLVEGTANNTRDNVFLTRSGRGKNINPTFITLFGIDLTDIDLDSMPANTVYYPVMPPSTVPNAGN